MKHWTVMGVFLAPLMLMVVTTLWARQPVAPGLSSTRSAVGENRRRLRRSNIQTLQDNGNSSELKKAIDRLQKAMNLPKPAFLTPPATPRRPLLKRPSATTRPATTQPRNSTTRPATTQPSLMTSRIKERIRKLNSIDDPVALADALFQADHPDLAVVFYDRAIASGVADEKKAWVLFQAANCCRKTDPQAALKKYDMLVAAHPDSLWGSIAIVEKDIVKWRNTNELTTLIKEIEQQEQQSPDLSRRK